MATIEFSTSSTMRVYVALADILPRELQPQASCAGLCYLIVEQRSGAGSYRIKAAALPQRLSDPHFRRVFTAFVEVDELAHALLYDRALQALPTCDLRDLLQEDARECSGLGRCSVDEEEQYKASPLSSGARESCQEECAVLLPELFVAQQTIADAIEVVDAPAGGGSGKRRRQGMLQLIWLQAAIMMTRRQMASAKWSLKGSLHIMYRRLHACLCRAFEACHQVSRMVVSARPACVNDRQVGWHVQVILPASLLAA